jgi:tripartite-type tricarboxylate transporter receptor subunit TctC
MAQRFNTFCRISGIWVIAGCVAGVLLLSASAWGASFPKEGKSIQFIVNHPAGGSSDTGARLIAAGLEKELGTSIMVMNKPGAGGMIGMTATASSKPDGYTIGCTNFPSAISSYLDPARKAVYTRKSFELLALHVVDPGLIAVKSDSPFKTLKEAIDAVKANPKKITIATTGIQSDEHFTLLQVQNVTGAKFAFVHFEGSAQALTAVLGGKIDLYCGNVGDLLAQYKSGAIRILGVTGDSESPFYPGIKTFEAQGFKSVRGFNSRGYAAPAGTPKEIVNILSGAMRKVTSSEEHKKKMTEMGLTLHYMDPNQYSKYWEEYEKMLTELMPLAKAEK